ncbi:MAG: formylglycine-generating enzyme family protein [Candidatus Xenobia bacterium]
MRWIGVVLALLLLAAMAPASSPSVRHAKDGSTLLRVPAGTCIMGSQDRPDEQPVQHVYLGTFWIARTAVTNAQFARFVASTGYHASGPWGQGAARWGPHAPVVHVSWYDARAYCAWAGLRLPTEAEREKASRGPDGRVFPWGDTFDARLCRTSVGGSAGSCGGPTAVGSYPGGASPYGCLDMAGNVWEWCSSRYAPYPWRSDDGRENPTGEAWRCVRGSSWYCVDPIKIRSANRLDFPPQTQTDALGFRVAGD